ncbi:recombinase family protein [Flaviaesturariibacter amylovorans]|uniref:Resolvase/invertase-type recombinase catalytic domain-containing protein n=1 Tax=Flaviaesturariibacter amylovorans TaxID=1084520 RepID=A0ABP8GHK9_9BACT
MPQPPRAALLARCSSEANVCSQILALRQFAAGNFVVNEEDVYGDQISGASALSERPALSRLMQEFGAGTKKYDVVLVQDRARIGRTPEQVQEVLDWLTQKGVIVPFLQD